MNENCDNCNWNNRDIFNEELNLCKLCLSAEPAVFMLYDDLIKKYPLDFALNRMRYIYVNNSEYNCEDDDCSNSFQYKNNGHPNEAYLIKDLEFLGQTKFGDQWQDKINERIYQTLFSQTILHKEQIKNEYDKNKRHQVLPLDQNSFGLLQMGKSIKSNW